MAAQQSWPQTGKIKARLLPSIGSTSLPGPPAAQEEKTVKQIQVTVQEMYAGTQENYDAFLAELDKSINPRPPDILYDKFAKLNPTAASMVLDAGCRHAVQACELHRRFGCQVKGIDLVVDNIREAHQTIAKNKFEQSVAVFQGDLHHLPFEDDMFDLVWCRDVLSHMADLHQVFKSCARVLKPGGKMLIYQMFETNLFTDEDANMLWPPTSTVRRNMFQDYFENAFHSAGFSIIEADVLGSEWREYGEETASKTTSKQLLRIARLKRHREHYIAKFGEKDYACELANCHWGVYQMLGKLSPTIYTLVNATQTL